VFACPGYRLMPTPAQQAILLLYCAHARFVWNLAVEQYQQWRRGRKSPPGYLEQCRQLTAARAEHSWLAVGSQTVQQQALRDFARAIAAFFDPANPARRPTWRKAGKAGLNRGILRSGWGLLVRRLQDKAPGRVEKVSPAFTSQRCSACGQVDANSRESQARFACTGHAVTARGGYRDTGPMNREPHLLASFTGCQ